MIEPLLPGGDRGKGRKRPTYGSKRRMHRDGYVLIFEPAHPLAMSYGYVFEHRKIMWDAGLLTDPDLQVHHINGDKTDNRIENLAVETVSGHIAKHHVAAGMEIKNQYGTFVVMTPEERLEKNRERCRNYQRRLREERKMGR